jgi:hypothetical protein
MKEFSTYFLVIRKYMCLCCTYDRVTAPEIKIACSYMKVNFALKSVIWFQKCEYETLVTGIVCVLPNIQHCSYSFLPSFFFFYFSLFFPLLFFRIKITAYNPPFQKVHYNFFLCQQLLSSQSCQTLALVEDTLRMVGLFETKIWFYFRVALLVETFYGLHQFLQKHNPR